MLVGCEGCRSEVIVVPSGWGLDVWSGFGQGLVRVRLGFGEGLVRVSTRRVRTQPAAMSDDAKRRREERRARLLANSESRMNKIHGVPSPASTTTNSDSSAWKAHVVTNATPAATSATTPPVRDDSATTAAGTTVTKRTRPPTSEPSPAPVPAPGPTSTEPTRKPATKRPSLTDKPALLTEIGGVVGISDILSATLGVAIAVMTVIRVGSDGVYEQFATGTLSTSWPIVVPFAIQEVAANGAGLQLSRNPLALLYGALGLGRRLCIFLFCFVVSLEFLANRLA